MQVNGMGPVGHVPYLGGVHLCLALPYAGQELPCRPCNESQNTNEAGKGGRQASGRVCQCGCETVSSSAGGQGVQSVDSGANGLGSDPGMASSCLHTLGQVTFSCLSLPICQVGVIMHSLSFCEQIK